MTNQKPDILKAIAAAMKVDAKHKSEATHALGRGLHLWLKYDAGTYTLAMSRHDVALSEAEQRVIKDVFEIPDSVTPVATTCTIKGYVWNRIWYRWSEPSQAEQPTLMEVEKESYYSAA